MLHETYVCMFMCYFIKEYQSVCLSYKISDHLSNKLNICSACSYHGGTFSEVTIYVSDTFMGVSGRSELTIGSMGL